MRNVIYPMIVIMLLIILFNCNELTDDLDKVAGNDGLGIVWQGALDETPDAPGFIPIRSIDLRSGRPPVVIPARLRTDDRSCRNQLQRCALRTQSAAMLTMSLTSTPRCNT